MNSFDAEIIELRLEEDGFVRALISYEPAMTPIPGQFLQAFSLDDPMQVLGTNLFPVGYPKGANILRGGGFSAAPPIPEDWLPGTRLKLRGPIGSGFEIPKSILRLALVSLGKSPARLLPLVQQEAAQGIESQGIETALYCDSPLPRLPSKLEANPLKALAEDFEWADLIVIEGSPNELESLRSSLDIERFPPNTQALVDVPMPCRAAAKCGICAFKHPGGKTILICEAGPVISWGKY